MCKLLVVTDQPFWRRQNGAHQRIYSLLNCLTQQVDVKLFYLVERTAEDIEHCRKQGYSVIEFDPSGGKIDLLSPLIDRARKLFQPGDSESEIQAATLDTYRWPLAQQQFKTIVEQESPDVVLFEYLVWGNLLDGIPPDDRTFKTAVDTHDALHLRNQQFKERGNVHWIDISYEQEAAELAKFDLIVSIQEQEARLFQEMAPGSDVMVIGHVPVVPEDTVESEAREPENPLGDPITRIGFVGSSNHANLDGIYWFLDECWPLILESSSREFELVVGGPVKEALEEKGIAAPSQVKFVGTVDSIAQFYSQVDFVINPVRFGSGLKIKTVESFCFGKPLVVHSHSATGLSKQALARVLVADDPIRFAESCVRLIEFPTYRSRYALRAREIGESEFSFETVYSPLVEWLQKLD